MTPPVLLLVGAAGVLFPSTAPTREYPAQLGQAQSSLFDRRGFFHQVGSAAAVCALSAASPSLAVSIDPDKYGDKELKIATVNKIRQNIRNECANDFSLIVPLFQLSLSDAFSYDPVKGIGGIDGSILLEMDRSSSKGLEKAAAKVRQLHSDLARTTEITYADVVAFAGAAAIEAVGGPKINVQLGRDEAKAPEPEGTRAGFSWEAPTLDSFRALTAGAGLSNAELVALIGTLGTLKLASQPEDSIDDEEDDGVDAAGRAAAAEVGAGYGDAMYGKARASGPKVTDSDYFARQKLAVDVRVQRIGTQAFDTTYFVALLDKKRDTPLSQLESDVLKDPALKKVVEEFAGSKQKFRETVRKTYRKLQLLGASYKGASGFLDSDD
mmetsp:Transcript_19656/g.59597  ORF Transcript_19656/g.59597 Transcript_19656/m.59597 type:complete len:382 (-) Transcript_19656:354-1499(-)